MRYYLSNDLNEVCSVWCLECSIAVKTEVVTQHFRSQHFQTFVDIETLRLKSLKSKSSQKSSFIETLIAVEYVVKNFETFHRCYHCGDVMDWSERKVYDHMTRGVNNKHRGVIGHDWDTYKKEHLVPLSRGVSQLCVAASGYTWLDVVNQMGTATLEHEDGWRPCEVTPEEMVDPSDPIGVKLICEMNSWPGSVEQVFPVHQSLQEVLARAPVEGMVLPLEVILEEGDPP